MMVLLYKFSGKMEIKLEKNIFLSNIRLASFPVVSVLEFQHSFYHLSAKIY